MTMASVVIQTYLTFTAKRWGQEPTITFTNGATAGSEVVTVTSPTNITVQIATGATTMAQVKAAIEAHVATSGFSAGDLVTVTITGGHTADTVATCVSALFSGGSAAAKASKTLGHLVFTAKSAGTAGNSTRIKYTSGGSLSVSVASADITIQLKNDHSSTNALIKAAVEASGPAAALVDLASDGIALSFVPDVSAAAAFTALAGGTAAVAATCVVQGVTNTASATGTAANGKTFTMTTGATAGAEVVTVSSGNVSVQIQNGTSTVTGIRTALNAAGAYSGTYTATGTASTTPLTVNAAPMTGAVGPNPATPTMGFYVDDTTSALTTSYQYFPMGNWMRSMSFFNDETSGTKTLIWSWDGVNNHGSLLPGQTAEMTDVNKGGIYIKEANGEPVYRIYGVSI
jgi:hypothetical protein